MLHTKTIPGLLGTLVLLVGTTAGAMETTRSEQNAQPASPATDSAESEQPEVERIVVSLPNGRKYVIERPKSGASSESTNPSEVMRVLADGSRISYGLAGGSGGKAGARRPAAQSGRGASSTGVSRGGSGASSAGGGGGGGASLGGASGGRTGGGGGGGGGGSGGKSGGGAFGGMIAGSIGGSAATTQGGGNRAPAQNTGTQTKNQSAGPVSTIGSPRYNDDQATGGQDVTFFDAGISAMVYGRTVYIWGAEIVQSTTDFQLVEGERFAFDGAVARSIRPTGQTAPLTSAEQLHAPLKLEFAPGATTTLTMFSTADNPSMPDRRIRNWTLRVR